MSYYTTQFDDRLAQHLKNGEVGFMPSDTVYGLSCLATDMDAVERIHTLKNREADKPLIILLADVSQAHLIGMEPEELAPESKLWPAPLTIIFPARPETPEYLHRGLSTIALRVPDDEQLRSLIVKTGPIVSTSANLPGESVAKNVAEAKEYFGDKLDFYVDMGTLAGRPSTIVKIKDGRVELVRQGGYELPENL